MAKTKESKGKWITKNALKLVSHVCVDGAMAGITASVVPLSMINPVVGGVIVIGSMIASTAACDRVIDKYVDDKVDKVADDYHEKVDPIVDSFRLIKKGKMIFEGSGEMAAKDFLKKNGFDEKQVDEIIRSYKKKS